jgi:hypothetical protein
MSARSDVKEMITHFVHDPGYLEERRNFRALMRSLNVAERNLAGRPRKRRRKRANSSGTEDSSERAGQEG